MKKTLMYFCAICLALSSTLKAEDPDYGNSPELAEEITVGSATSGYLSASDEDWFVFTPTAETKYQITFFNPSSNYKYVYVYQDQGYDDLTSCEYFYCNHQTKSYQWFFDNAETVYIKIVGATGDYTVTVTEIDTYPSDGYGNTASEAGTIVANEPPIVGTLSLDELPEYNDWFVLHTSPLHQYHIQNSHTINSDAYFEVYNSDGSVRIHGATHDMTLTSIHGEDFLIKVKGSASKLGNYYELWVSDIATFTDPDGNSPAEATPIVANTEYTRTLEYASSIYSDQDWFVFYPAENTRYEIVLRNPDGGYKYIYVYQDKGQTNLTDVVYYYANNTERRGTIFVDGTEPMYFMVQSTLGNYTFSVNVIENFPPDNHPQDMNNPETIIVDSTTEGTISPDQSNNSDWFIFNTEELHKYHVSLYDDDNCSVYFEIYDHNNNRVYGGTQDMNFVSWNAHPFKVKVYGDTAKVGNYYELTVIDEETCIDDYASTVGQAVQIEKDGTIYTGMMDYTATLYKDQDWFKFIAPIDGVYTFYLANTTSDYKYMYIYHYNYLNNLVQDTYSYANNGEKTFTANLTAGMHYIMIIENLGEYRFSVTSPEARCGDLEHPYPTADVNEDCKVNIEDLAIMASQWLMDTRPENDPA
ncbi:MAG: hypothetical protein JEZ07_13325 [Phycisphaerae bacterium]|nr:hypothetical protein [Phycisphaerae bacterium]